MNLSDRQSYIVALFSKCTRVLGAKANDYAKVTDAHQSFTEIADITKTSRAEVCFILLAKHLVSIKKAVIEGAELKVESLEERIIDAINYLALLYTLSLEDASYAQRNTSQEH